MNDRTARQLAQHLGNGRHRVAMLSLCGVVMQRPEDGALAVDSVTEQGDSILIQLSDPLDASYRRRLLIEGPRGLTLDPARPDYFELESARRVVWDDQDVAAPHIRPAVMAS
jgi:hypothetical protein